MRPAVAGTILAPAQGRDRGAAGGRGGGWRAGEGRRRRTRGERGLGEERRVGIGLGFHFHRTRRWFCLTHQAGETKIRRRTCFAATESTAPQISGPSGHSRCPKKGK